MGFFSRLWNMVSGFFSGQVSSIEQKNPEIVYENAIQERLKKHKELKVAVSSIIALRDKIEKKLIEDEGSLVTIDEQIDAAMNEGDEELALSLLETKESLESNIEIGRSDFEKYKEQSTTATKTLNSFQSEIKRLKQEKEQVVAKAQTAEARIQIQETLSGMSLDGDIQALEKVRDHVEKKQAEADVVSELSDNSVEKRLDGIKEKASTSRAQKRLEALKAKRAETKEESPSKSNRTI
jgi:phage shock protein A